MRIALDAMGSDAAPSSEIEGTLAALEGEEELKIVLLGQKDAFEPFRDLIAGNERIEFIDVPQVVGMKEVPSEALRAKTESSIAKGVSMLKEGKVDAFVSAGNTGAVVAFSLFTLGRIPGVQRPALAAFFPTPNGHTLVLDVGANVEAKPVHLVDCAVMGSIMVQRVYRVDNPRVGLLNVGQEESKGPQLLQDAYKLLKNAPVNFIGNVEASEVFKEIADVIVTDGFTGNIALKFGEGMGEVVLSTLRSTGKKYRWRGWVSKKLFKDFISGLNYEESGGAILLGVEGPVIISHGRSTPHAIYNALRLARFTAHEGVANAIKEEFT